MKLKPHKAPRTIRIAYKSVYQDGTAHTSDRPPYGLAKVLMRRLKASIKEGQVYKHCPGDGFHYVPGTATFYQDLRGHDPSKFVPFPRNWWIEFQHSNSAIFAHVEDICKLLGIDYGDLYRKAYPGCLPPHTGRGRRTYCERPATLADVAAVISDLEDINFSQLATELEDAVDASRGDTMRLAA